MPKFPISSLSGNLLTAPSGRVWAVWRLEGVPYGLAPYKLKEAYLRMHTSLVRSLSGEALLMGLCATTDPADVVQRMVDGVDLDTHPELVDEALARLDELQSGDLAHMALGERLFYLAVPLSNRGINAVTTSLGAAVDSVKDVVNWPRAKPALSDLAARREQAARIRDSLPVVFGARDATFEDISFIFSRSISRGALPEYSPTAPETSTAPVRDVPAGILPRPVLDEGARTDRVDEDATSSRKLRAQAAHNPMAHRVLKVWDERETPSYQVLCAIAGTPSGELVFPGMEWLGNLDALLPGVDWAQRLRIRSNAEIQRRNTKVLKELEDQVRHRSSSNFAQAAQVGMAEVLSTAKEFAEFFTTDPNEVGVDATTIFAVSAADEHTAHQRADQLAQAFKSLEFRAIREPGQQVALWNAMLPGSPDSGIVRSLAESTTSGVWAQSMPLISHQLGDGTGMVLAAAGTQISQLDEEAAKALNTSLTVAVCGELGAGKSVALKVISLGLLIRNRHTQCLAVDRSHTQEWATALEHEQLAAVECGLGATLSLDPLRILPPAEAADVAQTFLTVLLNIHPTSEKGALLAEVLEPTYRQDHDLTSLHVVTDHLAALEDPEAWELAKMLRVFDRRASAGAVFDDSLPPLSLDTKRIVFLTSSLELPDEDELANQRRFDQMSIAKIYGRAMYALIMGLAKRQCFKDPRYPALFVIDESHALNLSPESAQTSKVFIRDSRKHNAWGLYGSHDAETDFGDATQRALIGMRIVMRHTDPDLARKALIWQGFDPDKDDLETLVETVQGFSPAPRPGQAPDPDRLGEALIRDFRAQVDFGRILLPASAHLKERVLTTPPADEERQVRRPRKKRTIAAVAS